VGAAAKTVGADTLCARVSVEVRTGDKLLAITDTPLAG
jgi:hypothetical protein